MSDTCTAHFAACCSVIFQRLRVLVSVSVDPPSMLVGNNKRALTNVPHKEAIHCVLATKVTVFSVCCNSEVFFLEETGTKKTMNVMSSPPEGE